MLSAVRVVVSGGAMMFQPRVRAVRRVPWPMLAISRSCRDISSGPRNDKVVPEGIVRVGSATAVHVWVSVFQAYIAVRDDSPKVCLIVRAVVPPGWTVRVLHDKAVSSVPSARAVVSEGAVPEGAASEEVVSAGAV